MSRPLSFSAIISLICLTGSVVWTAGTVNNKILLLKQQSEYIAQTIEDSERITQNFYEKTEKKMFVLSEKLAELEDKIDKFSHVSWSIAENG